MEDTRIQGDAVAPVGSIVSLDELATLYRAPSRIVAAKKQRGVDDGTAEFLARSPFVLVGTVGVDGGVDVSPRGGPPGFVRVLDDLHVAIPDLNGNNLLDSLRAIADGGRAGLLVVLPGQDETVRINGPAWVTTDASVLDLWTDELRRPVTAIVVRADEVFIHCAKAFRRGHVWDPATWGDPAVGPTGLDVLASQGLIEASDPAARQLLERSYATDLAADSTP